MTLNSPGRNASIVAGFRRKGAAEDRNDDSVECMLNLPLPLPLKLKLKLVLGLLLIFFPRQSQAPKKRRETLGSRPTEGSPEGRHPAATVIWSASVFVGVPTKGAGWGRLSLVTFFGAAEVAKQRK
ncbi:hypothetical protein HNQ50_001551 [Silvimonas terrae]|uniref:Uncharacterized protein n=1 Tax=Silvimonas terrae TaxID=300266 RepID=A0A840RE80_9NEIS|nr:hypothetical protein [Silvimonas terrae]